MDSEVNGPGDQWLPVPEAAALVGVPIRSVYNWARSKRVRSRTENGVVFVSVDDLRAVAATRPRPNGGARAGSSASTGTETASLAQVDGDLAARMFEHFENGLRPIDVVKKERLAPTLVRSIHRDFIALRDLGKESKTPLENSLQELRGEFEAFKEAVSIYLSDQDSFSRRQSERIETAIQWLQDLPVPRRGGFQCWRSKNRANPQIPVRCGECGEHHLWGFPP